MTALPTPETSADPRFVVLRSTTDKLEEVLTASNALDLVHLAHVGGRDWVAVLRERRSGSFTTPSAIAEHFWPAGSYTGPAEHERGWVADQAARHARYDQAVAGRSFEDDNDPESRLRTPAYFALVEPELVWGSIRYGRYAEDREVGRHGFSAWLEDTARSWIVFFDDRGVPCLFWPRRDESGGVIGAPVELR